MTIAVDFDGTIVTHEYPQIGREQPGAFRTLKRLQADGHRLILWTVREGELLEAALDFCRENGLEFFAANEHYTDEPRPDSNGLAPACRKLTADLYIDDRNLGGFPGWEAVYEMVSRRQSFARYYSELTHPETRREKPGLLRRIFG